MLYAPDLSTTFITDSQSVLGTENAQCILLNSRDFSQSPMRSGVKRASGRPGRQRHAIKVASAFVMHAESRLKTPAVDLDSKALIRKRPDSCAEHAPQRSEGRISSEQPSSRQSHRCESIPATRPKCPCVFEHAATAGPTQVRRAANHTHPSPEQAQPRKRNQPVQH